MFNQKEYAREWHQRHKEEINEKRRQLTASRRVVPSEAELAEKRRRLKITRNAHNQRWRHRHPEIAKAIRNRGNEKLKHEVMTAYGNGRAACVKCSFEDIRALSLDHINGGGNAHRNKDNGRFQGRKLYVNLRQRGFPLGYQTLCMNCQWIKRHENNEYGR